MAKRLQFPDNTELTLTVVKDKSNYFGELRCGKYVINKHPADEFETDLKVLEGKTIPVLLNRTVLYDKETGKTLTAYPDVFDKNKIIDLKKTETGATVFLENIPLLQLKEDELPEHLFDHRDNFKVYVNSDTDWKVVRYANLHQHTEYSLLDGITRIPDLAKKSEYACAITDHGNMYGYLEFFKAMKKQGKKPIIGFEAYVETLGAPRMHYTPENYDAKTSIDATMFDNEPHSDNNLGAEHMILLAKDNIGLSNLYKLCTESEYHFYRKPHVTYEMLEKYHEGIIATSACIAGTLGQCIKTMLQIEDSNAQEKAKTVYEANQKLADDFIQKMISIFGKDDFYIELQNHHFDLETRIMDRCRDYARKYNLKTTVGIDAHYLNAEDKAIHEMWLCKQTKKTLNDPKRMRFQGDGYYVHSSEEVLELFPNDLDAIDNTLEIADKCNVDIQFTGYHLPSYPLPEGETDENEYLRKLTLQGFHKIYAGTMHETDPVYLNRIEMELNTIKGMGWPAYFLIVQDFIAYAQDTNVKDHLERYFPKNHYDHSQIPDSIIKDYEIYVGTGRGSGAGSLVCQCIGITKVDPIKYDLLFERFLNPSRVSMPDIDTDFEDSKREQVIDYCRYKYGEGHVSKVITFGTSAAKAALKDIVRVMGLPVELGNKLSSYIPKTPGITIRQVLNDNPDFADLYKSDQQAHRIIDCAMQIEGLSTSRSIHACATCIADNDIVGYMPQVIMTDPSTKSKFLTTQLTGPELEERGLLKMDFLGLRTLGVAHEAAKLIESRYGKKIDYSEIPLNDIEVYRFIAQGNTSGVFQCESRLFTETLRKVYQNLESEIKEIKEKVPQEKQKEAFEELGEKCFNKLSDVNALVRPGPQEYIDDYVFNILHPNQISYDDKSMIDQLHQTYGIMLYQEQMMILTRQMAGFDMGWSDKVRKGTAKKKPEVLAELKEFFVHGSKENNIKGCVENGIPEKVAYKVWSDMEKFGGYAFNRSHAVAYSMHSIRTAWLSKYYPVEYMTAVMNSFIGTSNGQDKIKLYINHCQTSGIEILPPDVNKSNQNFTPEGDNIRFGIGSVKSIGASASEIIDERNSRGEFKDYRDFLIRMAVYHSLKKNVLEALIYCGALDSFEGTRHNKLCALEDTVKYIKAIKAEVKKRSVPSLFNPEGETVIPDDIPFSIVTSDVELNNIHEKEMEYTGFYVSGHPFNKYLKVAEIFGCEPLITYDMSDDEEDVDVPTINPHKTYICAGMITDFKMHLKKKDGSPFYTFDLEDSTGKLSCIVSPSWRPFMNNETLTEELYDGAFVMVSGKIKDRYGNYQLNGISIMPLSEIESLSKEQNILISSDMKDKDEVKKRKWLDIKPAISALATGAQSIYSQKGVSTKLINGNVKLTMETVARLIKTLGRGHVEKY